MLWQGRRESGNVEDRRGISGGGIAVGGGIIGAIFLIVKFLLGGGDPSQLPQQLPQETRELTAEEKAKDDERASFVKVVLADTEDVWGELFRKMGRQYQDPTLVLFRDATESGCGYASAATGPFYCPSDNKLYIDLSFYQELQEKFQSEEFKKQFDSDKLQKQIDEAMDKANEGMQKAKNELQQFKEFTSELEKDGLIDKKKGYEIEWKNGNLYINGVQQSQQVTNKYKKYYREDGKIKMNADSSESF